MSKISKRYQVHQLLNLKTWDRPLDVYFKNRSHVTISKNSVMGTVTNKQYSKIKHLITNTDIKQRSVSIEESKKHAYMFFAIFEN